MVYAKEQVVLKEKPNQQLMRQKPLKIPVQNIRVICYLQFQYSK